MTLLFPMCAERWEKFQWIQNDIRENMKVRKCNFFFLFWMEYGVQASGSEVEIKSSNLVVCWLYKGSWL